MNLSIKKSYEIICTLFYTFAFTIQFFVIKERVDTGEMTWFSSSFRSIMYMTIWTNVILYITFILVTFNKIKPSNQSYFSALMTYITIVATIYHVALSHLWTPTGYLYITDIAFHSVGPILYLIYWIFFTKKSIVSHLDSIKWLVYPAVYTVFFLTVGFLIHKYPYPIYDLDTLPFLTVLRNMGFTLLTYLFFGNLIIIVNNLVGKKLR